jgi:hypothetical protein
MVVAFLAVLSAGIFAAHTLDALLDGAPAFLKPLLKWRRGSERRNPVMRRPR